MTTNSDILQDIPDNKPVRIYLPLIDNKERYRLQGVYQKSEPPTFNLLFQPGTLPVDLVNRDESCIINVDMGGASISMEALISSVISNQVLEMKIQKSFSPDQMREFFRVDATTRVISKSFRPEFLGKKGEPSLMQGKTIDISGSGILACFPEKPPMDEHVKLELTLPTEPPEIIKILAHPVRASQTHENQWDVAYHFDDISVEDRDKIIGCCLVIQRRLLRLKVQVRDPA